MQDATLVMLIIVLIVVSGLMFLELRRLTKSLTKEIPKTETPLRLMKDPETKSAIGIKRTLIYTPSSDPMGEFLGKHDDWYNKGLRNDKE